MANSKKAVGLNSVLCLALFAARIATAADDSLFRDKVAPVFEARCVHCHGDDSPKGKFSLAKASGLLKGGDSGPAVVPGKPDESILLDMISGAKPEMPQKDKPLSKQEVEIIRSWIEQGANWPGNLTLKDGRFEGRKWWAFEPLKRPDVPSFQGSTWVRTPIDALVLASLEKHKLKPSPEADRGTLIRRLSFDLLGLPPTPEEVEAFVHDPRPLAYEALVDRLLASPHHGERWGRHWLDVVHYGDTHGYDKDKRRDHAWPYRDYVIGSFNNDVPFGRFIREQIAGDAFWPGDPKGIIATGFIASGPWDFVGHVELREGTVDKLKTRLLDRDDMLSTTMSSFVSMTVHCARCHDHKFDPIAQTDYYRLQAVFAGVDRGDRPYQSLELAAREFALKQRRDAVVDRSRQLNQKIDALTSPAVADLDDQIKAIRRQLRDVPGPASRPHSPTNGYHSGIYPHPDVTVWVQVDLGSTVPLDEIRLMPARPTDFPDTPGFGFPARFRVEVSDDPNLARSEQVAADSHPDHLNVEDEPYIIRPRGRSGRYIRVTATRLWKRSADYVFALGELEVISNGVNQALRAKVTSLDSIEAGRWSRANLVDGFDSRHARPEPSDAVGQARHELLFQLRQAENERKRLADSLIDPTLRADRDATLAELKEIDDLRQSLPTGNMVYAVRSHAPRPIAVLRRGEVEQPGETVGPGTLACLPDLPATLTVADAANEGSRRAALADWLASPKNVLTWRSMANRLWYYHFGRGIVETPNDFGRNGALPTHPELLDWLAVELRDNGQSLKALHRLIVSSATYRQASGANSASELIDADNRHLWRQNRRRLDAEAVRDSVLTAAGTLDRRMGGPGFELFYFKDDHSPIYDHTDPARVDNLQTRRRTIYRFTVRSVPNPFMEALDCADPNLNTPVRSQTLTALQALALWNDLFMVRQSQEFARRLEKSHGDRNAQIVAAYRCALGREPRAQERGALVAFAAKYGLAHACRVIWNTNEFVFVD
jgi:mono/diheme cytochrome c family protein